MEIQVEYTIDKGVPIPVRRAADPVPVSKLKVGDSLVFPLAKRATVASNASRIKKVRGWEYTIKKISDTECRVWRVV
jgi:hypothetical protein